MNGNIIKSFLISLGFGVNDSDLARFNKAIAQASVKVAGLYAGIKVAAAGIFYGISKISQGFEDLGYEFRIIAPAINKVLLLRQAMLSAFKSAGINITQAVQASVRFNFALAKTRYAIEAIYKSAAIKFLPVLTKQMDIFRKQIYDNMPKIQKILESFVRVVFSAFQSTVVLGGRLWSVLERVYDFFVKLDKATQGWSTIILGVVAAWKLLNLSFLATPLGLVIAGLITLLELWDDFKTFKEGGQSLINWSSDTTKAMVGLSASIALVYTAFKTWELVTAIIKGVTVALRGLFIVRALINVFGIFGAMLSTLFVANPFGLIVLSATALISLLAILILKWDKVKAAFSSGIESVKSGASALFESGKKRLAGFGENILSGNLAPNLGPVLPSGVTPLGASSVNNSSRQNINQETNIIVQGSADANSTGKAVATEQSKVNFDMARNMKGSVR